MSKVWTPRDYQVIAADFIIENQRCNLWAQPGLGKTSTVYMVLDILSLAGSGFFPALVIAPLAPAETAWLDEPRKWDIFNGMRVVPILGPHQRRDEALTERADVFIVNYENVEWLVERLGGRWPFGIVIADESPRLKSFRGFLQTNALGHTFLNSGKGGARSTALAHVARKASRWINLTGTPATNGLKDLWGPMWFVDHGSRLGRTFGDFKKRWFFENPFAKAVELRHPDCEAEIHAAVADVSLSLRTADWLPVHEPLIVERPVILPPDARKLYTQMERDLFVEIQNNPVAACNAAVLSNKLLQMASGAVYDSTKAARWVHDAKIEGLRSIVEELSGEPLLVAYWYQWEQEALKRHFPHIRFYRGKEDQDDWNAGRLTLMGVQPASAGHGVDLQYGGCKMTHFTHTWDLELRLQIAERIGPARQLQAGFDRVVTHYNLVAKNTLDEDVLERQDAKQTVQSALMAARAKRPT